MMRLLSVIIVGIALTILIVTWLERTELSRTDLESPYYNEIRISGTGNTLASVASRLNDPKRFSYDPGSRIAVCHATLIIEGELLLGVNDDPDSSEFLEMATEVCGDLRIEVRPGGALRLYYSTIRTVSQVLSNTSCSRGYSLFVDGTLVMDHGRISYLSGSTSQCLREGSQATIRQSTFSYCDGSALSCVNVDGSRITIEDSEIIGSGNWGLVVHGMDNSPLEIRNSVLDAQLGAVFLTGESATVRLVDCVFDPAKIEFNRPDGQVIVAWTRRFKVIDAKTNRPRTDVLLRARNVGDGSIVETVETRTNNKGDAEMVLTEWIARPGTAVKADTQNKATIYQISVIGE
ncbi:MAG: right-handed parallel beta-helix repeat-containing protein, partial [Planctomycetota bacterium]